jgi:hypothetical protein
MYVRVVYAYIVKMIVVGIHIFTHSHRVCMHRYPQVLFSVHIYIPRHGISSAGDASRSTHSAFSI